MISLSGHPAYSPMMARSRVCARYNIGRCRNFLHVAGRMVYTYHISGCSTPRIPACVEHIVVRRQIILYLKQQKIRTTVSSTVIAISQMIYPYSIIGGRGSCSAASRLVLEANGTLQPLRVRNSNTTVKCRQQILPAVTSGGVDNRARA